MSILSCKNVYKKFKGNEYYSLENLSLEIGKSETFAVIGASGSGKTTLAKCLLGLENIDSGNIYFEDNEISNFKSIRSKIQMVFQDPYSSLNPKFSINEVLSEPFIINKIDLSKKERDAEIVKLLELVNLKNIDLAKRPQEFSGGEKQRIAIARALALKPQVIIYDEPLSAIDVIVQKQIVVLLQNLQKELGLTYLFITHDLRIVKTIADKIAVMKDGKIVDIGKTFDVISNPQNEYTRMLLESSMISAGK